MLSLICRRSVEPLTLRTIQALLICDAIASFGLCAIADGGLGYRRRHRRLSEGADAARRGLGHVRGSVRKGVSRQLRIAQPDGVFQLAAARLKTESYSRFCGTAPEHLVFGLIEALKNAGGGRHATGLRSAHPPRPMPCAKPRRLWSQAGALGAEYSGAGRPRRQPDGWFARRRV